MNSILNTRLRKLERHTVRGNPLATLSDEELDDRLADLTARIEQRVGMPVFAYGVQLRSAMQGGEPLPNGLSKQEARSFLFSLEKSAKLERANVH